MTHILKDATDRIRSVSKEQDPHRGRNPEPRRHDQSPDHEQSFEERFPDSNPTDGARCLDNWKEFRKGKGRHTPSSRDSVNCM